MFSMCIQSRTVCRSMGRGNTVTGTRAKGKGQGAKGKALSFSFTLSPLPISLDRGFTLLELMIVISILIILVSVALPQYQKTVMHARETVLSHDLFDMRSLIDQYAADKAKLPQSLDDLATPAYMTPIPTDPITDQLDWAITTVH